MKKQIIATLTAFKDTGRTYEEGSDTHLDTLDVLYQAKG